MEYPIGSRLGRGFGAVCFIYEVVVSPCPDAGGYYYLSDKADSTKPLTKPTPNGVLHALCITLHNVMASAAEAELGALFYNGQVAEPIRTCLEEMGYPQPNTPIKIDNSTAAGIVNSSIRQKKNQKPWTCVFIG